MHTLEEVNAAKRGLVFNHSRSSQDSCFCLVFSLFGFQILRRNKWLFKLSQLFLPGPHCSSLCSDKTFVQDSGRVKLLGKWNGGQSTANFFVHYGLLGLQWLIVFSVIEFA